MVPVKVAVLLPTHEMVPASFAYDFAKLLSFTAAGMEDTSSIGINMVSGTYIHTARQQLAMVALNQGVTHVLWVDSDMRFPKDALFRLMQHNVPVVGVNYSTRGIPPSYVAIKKSGTEPGERAVKLVTTPESTGLEEVDAMGFGLTLMKIEAVQALWDGETPLFGYEWQPNLKRWMGEDVLFCKRLREKGIKILVDHDLSKECAHVGQFEYRIEHAMDQLKQGDPDE